MHTSLLSIVALVLPLTVARQQVSSQQLIQNIDTITDLTSQTGGLAAELTYDNLFTNVFELNNNFQQLNTLLTENIFALDSARDDADTAAVARNANPPMLRARQFNPAFDSATQLAVCAALRGFVSAQQRLYAALVDRRLVLQPFAQVLAQILRNAEAVVDQFVVDVGDVAPVCRREGAAERAALGRAMAEAVGLFDALVEVDV